MSETRKPRRWSLANDPNFDSAMPVVTCGDNIHPGEEEVNVIESLAVEQLMTENTTLHQSCATLLKEKNLLVEEIKQMTWRIEKLSKENEDLRKVINHGCAK